MHSRVFQIGEQPFTEDELTRTLPEWFENSICDYYVLIEDEGAREGSLDWLSPLRDGDCVTIDQFDIDKRFDRCYQEFCDAIEELKLITREQFESKSDISFSIYKLNSSYNSKYEFYFYADGDLYTMDEFYREFGAGPYYIGSVFDYHS